MARVLLNEVRGGFRRRLMISEMLPPFDDFQRSIARPKPMRWRIPLNKKDGSAIYGRGFCQQAREIDESLAFGVEE